MANELILQNGQLPAHLQGNTAAKDRNAAALAGTGGGASVNRLSLKGSRFRMIQGGEEVQVLPSQDIDVVVLRVNDGITKTYYKDAWNPNQEAEAPTCQSDDGVTPRADATAPQARTCAECPHNVWGSKINPLTGAQGKACADTKRMSIIPAGNLDDEPFQLAIPAASLKDWGGFVRKLCAVQPAVPYNALVTKIAFDTNATFPKLVFSPVRFLSADEYQRAEGRYDEEAVKLTAGLAEAAAAYAQQRVDAGQAMGIPGANPAAQARAAVDNVRQQAAAQATPPPAQAQAAAAWGGQAEPAAPQPAQEQAAAAWGGQATTPVEPAVAAAATPSGEGWGGQAEPAAQAAGQAEPAPAAGWGGQDAAPEAAAQPVETTQEAANEEPTAEPAQAVANGDAGLDAVFGADWDD